MKSSTGFQLIQKTDMHELFPFFLAQGSSPSEMKKRLKNITLANTSVELMCKKG